MYASRSKKRAKPDASIPTYKDAAKKGRTRRTSTKSGSPSHGSSTVTGTGLTMTGSDPAPKTRTAVRIRASTTMTCDRLRDWQNLDNNDLKAYTINFEHVSEYSGQRIFRAVCEDWPDNGRQLHDPALWFQGARVSKWIGEIKPVTQSIRRFFGNFDMDATAEKLKSAIEQLYQGKGESDVSVSVEDFYSAREGWKPNETVKKFCSENLHERYREK